MKPKRILSVMVLLLVLFSGFASVPPTDIEAETVLEPATVYNSEVFVLNSEIRDQDYRIYVALPQGYDSPKYKDDIYPVIYSMDGNWNFSSDASSAMHLMAGNPSNYWLQDELTNVIVVGVGYPTDNNMEIIELREIDMLPDEESADFLNFMEQELIPHIEENYRADPSDRTIAGNSLGGLFALYAMFNSTETFQRYLSLSPALSHPDEDPDQRMMFDIEAEFAVGHDELPVDLFISIGEIEPEFIHGLEINAVENVEDLYEIMESRDYAGLDMDMMIVDDLGHWGSYPVAFTYGLVKVFD